MKNSVTTERQSSTQVGRENSGLDASGPELSQEAIGLAEKLSARLPVTGAVLALGSVSGEVETNLATQLARALQIISSKRVLLIEAGNEARRTNTGTTLMDILGDGLPFDGILDDAEPVTCLRYGNPPDNEVELIVSDRFREFLQQARRRFPWVIVQCWNLPVRKEAATLVSRADAVVLACKSGRARTRDVRGIIEMCAQLKTEFVGLVLV